MQKISKVKQYGLIDMEDFERKLTLCINNLVSATSQNRSINFSINIIFYLQNYEFWCLYRMKTVLDQLKHLCCMGILTYTPLQSSATTSDISISQIDNFKKYIFPCDKEILLYYFTLIL